MGKDVSLIASDTMVRYENDPTLEEYAMIVMMQYTVTFGSSSRHREQESGCASVVSWGRPPFILISRMCNWRLPVGCDALYSLFGAIFTEEWPPITVLQAVNNHSHCAKIEKSACNLLARVLEFDRTGGAETTLLAGCVEHYISAILQGMQYHPDKKDMFHMRPCTS